MDTMDYRGLGSNAIAGDEVLLDHPIGARMKRGAGTVQMYPWVSFRVVNRRRRNVDRPDNSIRSHRYMKYKYSLMMLRGDLFCN